MNGCSHRAMATHGEPVSSEAILFLNEMSLSATWADCNAILQVDTKPASDIIAGAVARAASQGTIHPLDTLKVRMQAQGGLKGPLSKIGKLVPPAGAQHRHR